MQHFKPLFPVQRPRRRADHLKMIKGVRFNAVQPRPRRFDILRFNRKREKLCLDKAVVAPFKLRPKHIGVFGSDTVKLVALRGNSNTLFEILLVGITAD